MPPSSVAQRVRTSVQLGGRESCPSRAWELGLYAKSETFFAGTENNFQEHRKRHLRERASQVAHKERKKERNGQQESCQFNAIQTQLKPELICQGPGLPFTGNKGPTCRCPGADGGQQVLTVATPSRVDPGAPFLCRAVCSENGRVLLGCLCLGWGGSCFGGFGGSGQSGEGEQSHSQRCLEGCSSRGAKPNSCSREELRL